MERIFYLDIFFSINFLMDLLIVLIVAKLLVQPVKLFRVLVTGMIGAIYACLIVLFPITNIFIQFVITYIVMGFVMIMIPFRLTDVASKIKALIILYAATFILNGIMNTISKFTGNEIVIIILTISVSGIVIYTLVSNNKSTKDLCLVKVIFNGKSIAVTALVDTGNSLTEPISRKPVSIIETGEIKKLLGGIAANEKVRMIPFNSVGKQGGVIPGIQVDSIIINQNGRKIEVKDSIIGVYNKKLSSSDEYNMLLNPNVMEIRVKEEVSPS